ncbi:YceI family protein [Adhaeribacter radiodurans]|uniref:YceI family protein n=1 Tax=Adhaeribacter radiodurans TaxID=2745197 RepID=A0A7L7L734_9BACT|nr:YceI family protein [Adhaeribacter radiodurans]QMU28159.1 YceI family protein [Adhaeribacter radiodurans]
MKKLSFILSFLVLSLGVSAQSAWKADPNHSRLGFTVTHLGIADVPGHFDAYDVTITASNQDFSDAVVEMTAQTASINTRVEPRDKHLKSADFFDVEKFPAMTFKSTSIRKAGENKYKLTGNLTLRGITKPVTVDMRYRGTTANPNAKGAPVAGIQITGTIKRSDFGLGKDFPAPMISDEVEIKADGEFGQK